MELELNLKLEQVKTREQFREETEEEVNSLTQDKPGDIVELGINLRCTKPQPKGYTRPEQHKQTKNQRSNLELKLKDMTRFVARTSTRHASEIFSHGWFRGTFRKPPISKSKSHSFNFARQLADARGERAIVPSGRHPNMIRSFGIHNIL